MKKELGGLKLVDEINSNSVHGYTTIRVKFDFKNDSYRSFAKSEGCGLTRPGQKRTFLNCRLNRIFLNWTPSSMPIMNINLRGSNAALLKDVAEDLEKEIEEISEISEVDIRGIQEQEMRIDVDPVKSQAVNVSLDDIQNAGFGRAPGGAFWRIVDGWNEKNASYRRRIQRCE